MKALEFVGSSLDDLMDFPLEARRAAGFELWQVQRGLNPSTSNRCPSSGRALLKSGARAGRVACDLRGKFEAAIYVLHAFRKKTQKTRKEDIELAARRYKLIGD